MVILYIALVIIGLPLAYWIFMMISSIFINTHKIYTHNSKFYRWILNSSTFLCFFFARIHVHAEGMEKVPKGTRFLLVGNHESNFDPIVTWYIFQKYDLAFLSKAANFKIPFYGRIIRKCCFREIDRENPANAARTLKDVEGLINTDECSLCIYPEGTRGNGKGLLPFHNGIFYVAKNTKSPIVVIATKNTRSIAKNFPLRRSDVQLCVVDVIPVDFVTSNRTNVIGERVRTALNKELYVGEE